MIAISAHIKFQNIAQSPNLLSALQPTIPHGPNVSLLLLPNNVDNVQLGLSSKTQSDDAPDFCFGDKSNKTIV